MAKTSLQATRHTTKLYIQKINLLYSMYPNSEIIMITSAIWILKWFPFVLATSKVVHIKTIKEFIDHFSSKATVFPSACMYTDKNFKKLQ